MTDIDLEPIDLSLPLLKEKGAHWLVEAVTYIAENPLMIVNEFLQSGITGAIDGAEQFESDDGGAEEPDDEDEFDVLSSGDDD